MPDGEGRVVLAPGLAVIGRMPDAFGRTGQYDALYRDNTGQRFIGQGVRDNIPIAICLRNDEQSYRRRQIEVACHGFTQTGNSEPGTRSQWWFKHQVLVYIRNIESKFMAVNQAALFVNTVACID